MSEGRRVFPVPAALGSERLDRIVAALVESSRSAVAEMVSAGRVQVNGVVVTRPSTRVAAGAEVAVDLPVEAVAVLAPDPDVDVEVVYADADVIVVNKAAGIVVHPGAGNDRGTLIQGLLARFPELAYLIAAEDERPGIVRPGIVRPGIVRPGIVRPGIVRPGIVHRLDVGTSGLLLVARSPEAFVALKRQFAEHAVARTYLAVVEGAVASHSGTVDAPIGRNESQPTLMAVRADGRPARTHYTVVERLRAGTCTVLECRLETGRTHQIRVHLAAIGHPVLGDARYGWRARSSGPAWALNRPFLHACRLAFVHPISGAQLTFEAALPPDLSEWLETARERQSDPDNGEVGSGLQRGPSAKD